MIYRHKFYLNPPNITQLYQESILRGLNAIHVPSDPVIIHAIIEARETGKKIIAMKSLAGGMLKPMNAFEYLVDKVDGVVVGITSLQELDELLNTAGKYFG